MNISRNNNCDKNLSLISSLKDDINKMNNPIAVTMNLRYSISANKKTDQRTGRKTIFFNDEERERIYALLRDEFFRQSFHNHERKPKKNRPPIIIGNIEYGSTSEQPHIHFAVDMVGTTYKPTILYLINKAIEKVRSHSRFVTDDVEIALGKNADSGWIDYLCKFSTSNLLYG